MSCRIIELRSDKKKYIDLLLLADEQESMIDRYLERGEMFVLEDDEVKAVCVVTDEGEGICELKNIAVVPGFQRQGYGKKLIKFLLGRYAREYRRMIVGTGDVPSAVGFYKSCGFEYSHRLENFFTDNYDHPMIEDGILLRDMVYLKQSMKNTNYIIRETTPADFDAIMEVEKQAFGYDKEARLVAELLCDPTAHPVLSLLAFDKEEAVGHILFTRVYFNDEENSPMMHILAPLAVKPAWQQQGIGGMLIKEGVRILRAWGSELVFVLGHKEYYPKYGFEPFAARRGYLPPYPMAEEDEVYWMVRPVGKRGFNVGMGSVKCCEELNRPEHWRNEAADR